MTWERVLPRLMDELLMMAISQTAVRIVLQVLLLRHLLLLVWKKSRKLLWIRLTMSLGHAASTVAEWPPV